MGRSRFALRLWGGVRQRRSLGRLRIKFYPPAAHASLVMSPALAALRRGEWQWLYLQHLAECLGTIADEHEAARLLVAARTLAEDFIATPERAPAGGDEVPVSIAGVAELVPEQAGGTTVSINVVRHGREMPGVQLEWSLPQARERLASSNLVLLVHIMRTAAHPLERYELYRKIGLFTEFCDQAGRRLDREALRAAPIFALVHADITDIARSADGARRDTGEEAEPAPAPPALPVPLTGARSSPPARVLPLGPHRWPRPGAAIAAAACLWTGLVLGAFFAPRYRPTAPPPRPPASVTVPAAPSPSRPPAVAPRDERAAARPARREAVSGSAVSPPGLRAVPPRRRAETARPAHATAREEPVPPGPAAGRETGEEAARPGPAAVRDVREEAEHPLPAAAREEADAGPPRFRVVSGLLSRDVAQLRSRSLAESGIDAFVHMIVGNVAQLQYGAYRSRETAEADAQRIRAQGYTAVVVRW
jgi:hypothetical protein